MDRTGKRFNSLTGLRGILIFMIVIHHMGGYFGEPFASVLNLPYQWGGVMGNSFFFHAQRLCDFRRLPGQASVQKAGIW